MRKILLLVIIKKLRINIYNINEYINLKIYLLNKNNIDIILVKREFYMVDNLIIKILL